MLYISLIHKYINGLDWLFAYRWSAFVVISEPMNRTRPWLDSKHWFL